MGFAHGQAVLFSLFHVKHSPFFLPKPHFRHKAAGFPSPVGANAVHKHPIKNQEKELL